MLCVLDVSMLDVCTCVVQNSRVCTAKTHTSTVNDARRVIQVSASCTSVTTAVTDALVTFEAIPDFRCNNGFMEGTCMPCLQLVADGHTRCSKHTGAAAAEVMCDDCIGKALADVTMHGSVKCLLKGGAQDKGCFCKQAMYSLERFATIGGHGIAGMAVRLAASFLSTCKCTCA